MRFISSIWEYVRGKEDVDEEEGYLIWWTSQRDCEFITRKHGDLQVPEYLYREFLSRYGRNGRGRLWVPEGVPVGDIEWDTEKDAAHWASRCGGIVFHSRDLAIVLKLDGFVTDLDLNYVM